MTFIEALEENRPEVDPGFQTGNSSRFSSRRWHEKDRETLTKDKIKSEHAEGLVKEGPPGSLAFTANQRAWLELMRDHIATSLSLEPDDFGYSPFAQRGGLGKAHQLFGGELNQLMEELNATLAA
jgi:hypothetical protein